VSAAPPRAGPGTAGHAALHPRVLDWYAASARDLPWRRPEASPWGVLVSEVMLQQTPVARVEPVWRQWLARWPTPAALAREAPGEAVRAWGRLGYPRRALRLHAAAARICEGHGGQVPDTVTELLALPGVGSYTASAVACFAFGRRAAVVDTNVRRVLARAVAGHEHAPPSLTRAELRRAEATAPADAAQARAWAVAVMELGALVCTARRPRCGACPLADVCAWQRAGRPAYAGPHRRTQTWAGSDRQVRGALLALLRESTSARTAAELRGAAADDDQRERCLESLVVDRLVEALPGARFRLPA
jgi:A/G-specific adenine glycosylase